MTAGTVGLSCHPKQGASENNLFDTHTVIGARREMIPRPSVWQPMSLTTRL